MSHPLCALGAATFDMIGLNPRDFDYDSEAHWPDLPVFDGPPFYQATGLGERILVVKLAARPHVMGGMDQYAIVKGHHERQDVVPFIRLAAGYVGEMMAEVAITRLGHREERLAPGGVGRRHEFILQLKVVETVGGGFG